MRILFLLTILALPLSACKTTVQDGPRKVTYEDGSRTAGHGGTFCPPGQAKKGNC